MSKPEAMPHAQICSDCGWPDECRASGDCTRAVLASPGFDTGLPLADAPSAIIEPPTAAELAGAAHHQCANCQWPAQCRRGVHCLMHTFVPADLPPPETGAAPRRRDTLFTRAQVRAAIAEIEGAQKQIAPALNTALDPYCIEAWQKTKTAAAVLEALPEAVAFAFGLSIRGACSFCSTTIFNDDPKATDSEGRDVCEAHA